MDVRNRSHTPIELWIFVVGYLVYGVAHLLRWLPGLPVINPLALFPTATALGVIFSRAKKPYWATIVLVGMSIGYPFLRTWLFPALHDPSSTELWWHVVPQILLLALLFSPRVRRYVALPNRADELVRTRCNWCNRSEGELEEVVLASRRGFAFGRAPEPTEYWVHPEHERAFLAWHEKKERHAKHLLIALFSIFGGLALIVPIVMINGGPGLASVLCGSLLVALGIAYLVLPTGDLGTIRWLGLRRALAVGRWTGAGLVVVGLGLLFVAFRLF